MKWIYKTLPWFFVALFGAEIIAVVMPKRDGQFHIREFGRLPVLLNGRIQPFDSVGLNSLRQIRSTGDVPLEEKKAYQFRKHPKKLKSTEWLLEVMLRPEQADERSIFLIHHPELLGELKLQEKGIEMPRGSGLRYYTFKELEPVRDEVQTQALRIQQTVKEEKQRTPVQTQTVKLENALVIYQRLKNSLRPQTSDDFAAELAEFQKLMVPGIAAFNAQQERREFDQDALERFAEPLNHYFVMSKWALPLIAPPLQPTLRAPVFWKEEPRGKDELARFVVADDRGGRAEVSVSEVRDAAEAPLKIVNLYRGQMGLTDLDAQGLKRMARKVRLGESKASLFEIGAENEARRMFLVVGKDRGRTWAVKMHGDATLLRQQKKAFLEYAGSFNWHNWANAGSAILETVRGGDMNPTVTWYAKMATAYRYNRPVEFNQSVAEYKQWLQEKFRPELRKARWEFFYNDVKAFLHAMIIYIFAFVLACGAIAMVVLAPSFGESLRRSAFYLVLLAGLVHTSALIFRMVLEGRPPVTNLYSSAIFIGWGAMVLGVVLERIYRLGVGILVAALAGFTTLLIAHNLALGGDTMEMLRAVLDTNVWLATHVVIITLGYASTFIAGLLAITYIFLGVFTPTLALRLGKKGAVALGAIGGTLMSAAAGPVGALATGALVSSGMTKRAGEIEVGKALAKMVYGIICFATLFSFTGTVLGGIWADQSWGRFWGWDPKENGALIIVLWNAIVLHARWGGLVRERGLMNMAIFGNIVTSFSWFGVNMLGIGLHSYGFMDAAFKWLMLFVGSQLFIIGLGLLPKQLWRSFRAVPEAASVPQPVGSIGGKKRPASAQV